MIACHFLEAVVTELPGGIGRATCDRLAREGARIVAVDLRAQELEPVVEAVRDAGPRRCR